MSGNTTLVSSLGTPSHSPATFSSPLSPRILYSDYVGKRRRKRRITEEVQMCICIHSRYMYNIYMHVHILIQVRYMITYLETRQGNTTTPTETAHILSFSKKK